MKKDFLIDIKQKLSRIVGASSDPDHVVRFAAICHELGYDIGLLTLNSEGAPPWRDEQLLAATNALVFAPSVEKKAKRILLGSMTAHVIDQLPSKAVANTSKKELTSYIEKLLAWGLFEDRPQEEGVLLVTSSVQIDPILRCRAAISLTWWGVWRIKGLLPELYRIGQFSNSRIELWNAIYHGHQLFSEFCRDLRPFEKPLFSSAGFQENGSTGSPRATSNRTSRKIKVGFWSNKLGSFVSSMTTVHPWLIDLQAENLEVFLFSEWPRPDDPIQESYRKAYGSHFVDCNNLPDEAFVHFVRQLDLDVLVPLQPLRPKLARSRLARCHLDLWANMDVFGVPDQTVISEGMAEEEFVSSTGRRFIVIPDPLVIYSALPEIEIAERDANAQFAFGIFSRPFKYHSSVFDAWARIMRDCPTAVLFCAHYGNHDYTKFILSWELGARGVDPRRIQVEDGNLPLATHLGRFNKIDLLLDTFPIGAGMIAVDAFYMGVPLVTLGDMRGPPLHTKVLLSLLGQEAGMHAKSAQQYIEYAKRQYHEGHRPKSRREQLRKAAVDSPLFDYQRHALIMKEVLRVAATLPIEKMTRITL